MIKSSKPCCERITSQFRTHSLIPIQTREEEEEKTPAKYNLHVCSACHSHTKNMLHFIFFGKQTAASLALFRSVSFRFVVSSFTFLPFTVRTHLNAFARSFGLDKKRIYEKNFSKAHSFLPRNDN